MSDPSAPTTKRSTKAPTKRTAEETQHHVLDRPGTGLDEVVLALAHIDHRLPRRPRHLRRVGVVHVLRRRWGGGGRDVYGLLLGGRVGGGGGARWGRVGRVCGRNVGGCERRGHCPVFRRGKSDCRRPLATMAGSASTGYHSSGPPQLPPAACDGTSAAANPAVLLLSVSSAVPPGRIPTFRHVCALACLLWNADRSCSASRARQGPLQTPCPESIRLVEPLHLPLPLLLRRPSPFPLRPGRRDALEPGLPGLRVPAGPVHRPRGRQSRLRDRHWRQRDQRRPRGRGKGQDADGAVPDRDAATGHARGGGRDGEEAGGAFRVDRADRLHVPGHRPQGAHAVGSECGRELAECPRGEDPFGGGGEAGGADQRRRRSRTGRGRLWRRQRRPRHRLRPHLWHRHRLRPRRGRQADPQHRVRPPHLPETRDRREVLRGEGQGGHGHEVGRVLQARQRVPHPRAAPPLPLALRRRRRHLEKGGQVAPQGQGRPAVRRGAGGAAERGGDHRRGAAGREAGGDRGREGLKERKRAGTGR